MCAMTHLHPAPLLSRLLHQVAAMSVTGSLYRALLSVYMALLTQAPAVYRGACIGLFSVYIWLF